MANWYYGLHHHDQKAAAVLVSFQGHQEGSRCTSFTARGRKLGMWYCKGQKAGYAVLQGAESWVRGTARGRKLGTRYCKGQKAGYVVLQGAESRVWHTKN